MRSAILFTKISGLSLAFILILFLVAQGQEDQRRPGYRSEQNQQNQQRQNGQSAQEIPQDLSRINVEDLSDDQLRQYLNAARERGLTLDQMELALRQRGMTDRQIQLLRQRIQNLGQDRESVYFESERMRDERQTLSPEDQAISILRIEDFEKTQQEEFRERLFGASLFANPELTFEPSLNIPTPSNYQVGPGDEIVIDIWGASEASYQLAVTPEGYIRVQNLGPVYVNGLTIEEANRRIINRLSDIFSGLRGSNPNTFAQISLGNVKSVKVSIIGEAMQPGTYTISSLATVFNALYAAGGPSNNGTFRNIQIIRNNEVAATLDLYDFLTTGQQGSNIRVEDQDIIRIGPYVNRVQVTGEVKREEDLYELKEGETVADLIDYAGGFTDKAYTENLRVKRNTNTDRRILDINKANFEQFTLSAGDIINVEPILDRFQNRVQITGAVFREGEFELEEGLTVKKLLAKAEGLRGDAFLERATIYRTKEDFSTEVIPFNLLDLMRNESEDILLRREDMVKVSSIYDLNEEYFVEIKGEVRQANVFPYMESMTVEDLIVLAGGLLESASNSHVEVVRRYKAPEESFDSRVAEVFTFNISENLSMESTDLNFVLKPFDMVFVRKSPGYQPQQTVRVEGEILYPGFYGIQNKNERISDLIQRAGGLTPEAYERGATLIRKTEYFEEKNERQARSDKLKQLKRLTERLPGSGKNEFASESEVRRSQRLAELEITDVEEDDTALQTKMQRLQTLSQRDSLILQEEPREEEAIGINLVDIVQNPGSKHDLILQDGDILSIPKELQTVRLRGELLYPITVRHDQRHSFMEYVSQAGGFTDDAKKNKAYVVYANGSVDRTRNFLFFKNYPDVEPGSEIIVPSKPERRGLSAQETIGLTSGVATLSLVILRILDTF